MCVAFGVAVGALWCFCFDFSSAGASQNGGPPARHSTRAVKKTRVSI